MTHIRLPRSGRPIVTVLAAALLGALVAFVGPQIPTALDRPGCAETVMRAVSSDQVVNGTYACFSRSLQAGLLTVGVDSDRTFADRIGQNGEYHFLHKTADGGYVYEYDRPTTPHDRFKGAIGALAVPQMRADVRSGNILAVWSEPHDVRRAWAEITGQTQNDESRLFTIYLGSNGRITAIK
ncbi:MAG TPA: hypothetical protein VGT01_07910 [Candidatus Dormibacteraeota bacterium]|nr:hypothetical protein [Candidatus Dormibacteraeota bacterium]HEV2475669.1 hypothetical protein [Candidatus Dormibacteraeota bacterium]